MQDDDYTQILLKITVNVVKNLVQRYKELNEDGNFTTSKNIYLSIEKKESLGPAGGVNPIGSEMNIQKQFVKCQPQLVYLSTYFQVIASLIDKNNSVNIGKLVKRFPF